MYTCICMRQDNIQPQRFRFEIKVSSDNLTCANWIQKVNKASLKICVLKSRKVLHEKSVSIVKNSYKIISFGNFFIFLAKC